MKYYYLSIVFGFTSVFAQNLTNQNLIDAVHGIVYQGNEQYLITDSGYIKVQNNKKSVNDQWAEYYRKAYGDSTIQNHNTIIEQPSLNIPIQYFLPIGSNRWYDKEIKFDEDAFLYDFIDRDNNGNFNYKPGVIGIIGNMQNSRKGK
jgi:hypothetical protein